MRCDGVRGERPPACPGVTPVEADSRQQADEIDARMLVEVLVLGRQEGLHDALGNRLDRDEHPLVAGELRQQPTVSGMHARDHRRLIRSEEHTSELQSLMRISYAVFCLTKKKTKQ